ncbi:Co2+/Mg2+ efflux protein ApaG [Ideonella livida]|uniref:Protein ApaG n=1 Tax=Ideonella livida TaxID=2707176 RepID=A0A7C9PG10_9BURK|nr:Co2+/Mg2+ efflux protein ApaG [Ideonella livida]NDY90973.1 Co2+/Mg2+ efflux protein ApaG [Ideonella livida]
MSSSRTDAPADAQFTCSVITQYLPEQSSAATGQYAFSYTITIRNTGQVTGQLIARHWVITDAAGHTEEVRGLAVVGHQPLLRPGEQFEYSSWTRIGTPRGQMQGTFFCMTEDAQPFEAPVGPFELSQAQALH